MPVFELVALLLILTASNTAAFGEDYNIHKQQGARVGATFEVFWSCNSGSRECMIL